MDERVGWIEAHRLLVEQRTEELRPVVHPQPRRLVGEQAEGRTVRLGEAEAREARDHREDLLRALAADVWMLGHRASDEPLVVGLQRLGRALAAHGTPQTLGLPHAEPGERLRDLEHLVLEDDRPERLAQRLLQRRVQVGHLEGGIDAHPLAALDVGIDRPADDRARPHDRHLDRDLVEVLRARAPQRAHLRARLDLEDAGRLGVLDALVRRRIVVRDPAEVDPLTTATGDLLDAALDGREHPEAEQVDLQEARIGAGVLVPLGELATLHRCRNERHAVHERARRDDHPPGVLGEVARQAVGLLGQARKPGPATGPALRPERGVDVAVDVTRRPALAAACDALDLPRRQPERLAELADRAARAVRREGGDERRVLAPVALMHARDELLANVAREVQVDVRQRVEVLVEEAPEQELVGDRIDVAETREVTDDRRDARPATTPGGQQRPRRRRPAHLRCDLARELQHLVMQQEEPRETQLIDHAQLLFEAADRRIAVLRSLAPQGIAPAEARLADLGEGTTRRRVLGARVAVAEVAAEIEGQRLCEPDGLGDRLGMIGEARRHRLRRRQHMGVVSTPQRLGGIERRVLCDRDERVLQARALERVRVDVAGCDGRDTRSRSASPARPRFSAGHGAATGAAARPGRRRGRRCRADGASSARHGCRCARSR